MQVDSTLPPGREATASISGVADVFIVRSDVALTNLAAAAACVTSSANAALTLALSAKEEEESDPDADAASSGARYLLDLAEKLTQELWDRVEREADKRLNPRYVEESSDA